MEHKEIRSYSRIIVQKGYNGAKMEGQDTGRNRVRDNEHLKMFRKSHKETYDCRSFLKYTIDIHKT